MILGGPKTELPIAQMKSKKATVVGTLKEHGLKTGTCSMKRQASQHEQMLSNQRLMHIGIIWIIIIHQTRVQHVLFSLVAELR
jgi:hypothetical protein